MSIENSDVLTKIDSHVSTNGFWSRAVKFLEFDVNEYIDRFDYSNGRIIYFVINSNKKSFNNNEIKKFKLSDSIIYIETLENFCSLDGEKTIKVINEIIIDNIIFTILLNRSRRRTHRNFDYYISAFPKNCPINFL